MTLDLRQIAVRAAGIGKAFAASGVFEQGNNRGDQIEAWQKLAGGTVGESYCCDAAFSWYCKSYCQVKGYLTGATDHENRLILLKHADEFAHRTGILRTGSCRAALSHADTLGRKHSKAFKPSPGDQVFFDMPVNGHKLGYAHHTGLVLEVLGDGHIRTVEANTSAGDTGSQDNGQGCYERLRKTTYVVGYMHLEGLI